MLLKEWKEYRKEILSIVKIRKYLTKKILITSFIFKIIIKLFLNFNLKFIHIVYPAPNEILGLIERIYFLTKL